MRRSKSIIEDSDNVNITLSRYIRAASRLDVMPISAEGTVWTKTLTHRWQFEPEKAILFISCGGGSEEGEARLVAVSVIWLVLQRAGAFFFFFSPHRYV